MELKKDREIVEVVDPYIKEVIINTLNQDKGQNIPKDGDLTISQMELLTDLDISSIEVHDFTGLQYATNLTNLVMDKNKQEGINALINLMNDVAISDSDKKEDVINKPVMETSMESMEDPLEEMVIEVSQEEVIDILQEQVTKPEKSNEHGLKNMQELPLDQEPLDAEELAEGLEYKTQNIKEAVSIPDSTLKATIISTLNESYGQAIIEDVSPRQMELLSVLHINNCNISDLNGLEYATNLVELRLDNNNVSELSALRSLSKLTFLSAHHNAITDVLPLASLKRLTSLNLSHNELTNIEPLQHLSNLVYLNISNNGIADIEPLDNLKAKANVSNQTIIIPKMHIPNPEFTITNLLNTKRGTGLEVSKGAHVPDSWVIRADNNDGIVLNNALTHRILLQMSITFQYHNLVEADTFSGQLLFDIVTTATPIHFPDPVLQQAIIKVLQTSYNQNIQENSNITAGQMELLKVLDVSNLGIKDLTGLQYAKNLLDLNISGNAIHDISVISSLTNLVVLAAHHNHIEDITALTNITNLVSLELQNNCISNINSLRRLINIANLNLSHNRISNINPLQDLKGYANIREQTITIPQLELTMKEEVVENILKTPYGSDLQLQVGNNVPKWWQISPTINDGIHFSNVTATEELRDVDILFSYDSLEFNGRIQFTTILTSIINENVVDIPDSALRTAIIETLNSKYNENVSVDDEIRENQLELLTSLDVSGHNIKELTGLESAVNLVKLNISCNQITDISPLKGSAKLTVLALHGNNLHNLTVLSNIKGLTYISLDNNLINNISYLRDLTNLKTIELHPYNK